MATSQHLDAIIMTAYGQKFCSKLFKLQFISTDRIL